MKIPRLAGGLLIAGLTACGTPAPTATPSPSVVPPATGAATQTAPSTPSATPEPTTSPIGELEWQRVESLPGADEGSAAVSVTAGGPGFVAVGITGISPIGEQGAAVWTSTNGVDWTPVTDDTGAFALAVMQDVVTSDDQLVAVGHDITDPDQLIATAWTSLDGLTWERAPTDGQIEHLEGAQMISLTAGGPGFVAVGWEGRPVIRAAVWTSTDGVDWTLSDPLPGGEDFQVRSVATGADGTLVAVGDSINGGQSAVWTSDDGITWTAAGDPAMFEGTLTSSVVALDDGFLAAGSVGVDAAVWTSPDGEEWTLHQDPEAFPNGYMAGLFATEDGQVVAVGASQEMIEGTGSVIQAATAWYAE